MNQTQTIFSSYQRALERFKEVLALPKSDVVRDSAIQRFEFTLDLAWKTIKSLLEEKHGIICRSPKECFRQAYQQGLIEYDEGYLDLVDLRNETVHTYDEKTAEEILEQLPGASEKLQNLASVVEKQLES